MIALTELIGLVGSVAFITSAIPQALRVVQDGHAEGLAPLFVWLWWVGCISMTAYFLLIQGSVFLLLNYGIQSVLVSLILGYKYFPQRRA